jgi:hypothetical protein
MVCNYLLLVSQLLVEVLLLLKSLTATQNTEIQKIVAFADAFPRLFDIMQVEGMGNGSMNIFPVKITIHRVQA